jgi:A/G-specific adenine glycosylase
MERFGPIMQGDRLVNSVERLGISGPLLAWYEAHARDLPWRVGPRARARGERPDPYRVWLSEIMLQQTTIAHGTRYFLDFTRRWPTVGALAATEDEDVMAAWAGLGYYARARNLLKCARAVAASGGAFPRTAKALQALPGIGPYTAGAIAAIAFDRPEPAIDGNVERVAARLLALEGEWKDQKAQIRTFVAGEVPVERPGEFAEALMDLGATEIGRAHV